MKTLLLVDGSSYLYRAFHALPDFRNRNNEPTGAIYGVLNMLRRLHKDYEAHYSACVFDAKGKTFRDDLYAQYKSNRPPMPHDLAAQIEPLHECIKAMGWPMLIVEGVEADDVIGTLAKQAERENMRCIISTGDKDIAQLVNPQVTLINTMTNETLDEAGVAVRFGVTPARMLDYLALVGDTSDNIPGVPKVGPKTAVKWLAQFGTLDNLIVHADEIGGVVGENLRQALDWLSRSRELLTIKCDVPLPIGLHDLGLQPQNAAKLAELYERLDFKTWLRELLQEPDGKEQGSAIPATRYEKGVTDRLYPEPVRADYQTILTPSQLDEWVMRLDTAPLVSVDTETTSLDPMQAELVGLAFSIKPHQGAYVPLTHRYAGAPQQLPIGLVLEKLKPWLTNPAKPKLGQNLKYDKHIFANHGIALNGIVHDTLLQSYVLEPHRPHDMDNLALRHLGVKTTSYDEITGKGAARIGFDQVDIEPASQYAAEDADITLQLHQHLYPGISEDVKLDYIYLSLEMPVMDILFEIERNGVLLDLKLLESQSRELGEKMLALEERACTIAGQPFNLNSTKQIQEVLFNRLKLPVIKKTPGGVPSTDEDVLQRLALDYPLPKVLLDYRSLAKLKSTYTDKLPRVVDAATGRVHTNYAQAVAVTGRLASNEPNLQNIPVRTAEGRRIREAFIASPGHSIVSADYSQIELRIMAHISQDAGLLRAFAGGEDVHRATASEVFGVPLESVDSEQRRYAKVINFGLIYGMSEFGLASQLGIDRPAARVYMDRYFARYPGVANYMQRTRETARETGYVETVFGRRLWLPEINSSNGNRRQGAERAAINAPMQGTAADIIKLAMIAVHGWLASENLASKLIMQVHDELVLEVPDDEIEMIKCELPKLMGDVARLDVPLLVEVGVGPNWEVAH
ncbi:DNA polymerase I [Nitrosospira briensis]|uniref:DNA polymerase I n=1 Tax=Nitrosospira briensis TaxID=35799 RepID=A0A1I5AC85_9PROT|nr:DNA polymerase I [Nitrosospira briensis]SFN60075.1 DNA polymerase I [Nitrosospira briensis]